MGPSGPPLSSPTAVRCAQPKGRGEGGRVDLALTLRNLLSKSQRIAGGEAGGLRIVTRAATEILRGARLRAAGPAALASNLNAGGPMSTTSIAPHRVGRQGASTHLNRCRKALARLSRVLGPTGSTPCACSPKRSVLGERLPQVINELDDARREGFSARPGQSRHLWHRWTTILPAYTPMATGTPSMCWRSGERNRAYPTGGAVGFDRGRLQTWAPAQRQPNYAVRRIGSRLWIAGFSTRCQLRKPAQTAIGKVKIVSSIGVIAGTYMIISF